MKVSLSREECFLATRTRHAFTIDGQMGVNRDGTLKGYSLDVLSNTGAYASPGHSIASAGGNKVAYLYPRCAYAYSSQTCYTNLPSAGAMRGYGAPQVVFAVESMLDDAATALGIYPVEIRLRNAAREGDANPLTGKRIYSAGLPECLEKARCAYAYSSKTCYTNLPSAGAMRGYGAPQVVFAVESMLDDAATALGIDPVEIRLRNAAREGDANPLTGKRIYSAGLPVCLEKGRKLFDWEKRRAACQNQHGNVRRGVCVA